MDPQALATIAVEGGAFTARDDVPEDVKEWITKAITAMAGGTDEDVIEDPALAEGDLEKEGAMPAFAVRMARQIAGLTAAVKQGSIGAPKRGAVPGPSADLLEQRKLLVQGYLMNHSGLLSAEAEEQLVDSGDILVAKRMVVEVKRMAAKLGAPKRSGATEKDTEKDTEKQAPTPEVQLASQMYAVDPAKVQARMTAARRAG